MSTRVGSPSDRCRRFAAPLLAALALATAGCDRVNALMQQRQTPSPPEIDAVRYVANSGMLLTINGTRFLIDAPIRDGIAPYATSPAEERARLENARPPYEDIDAILITHWHEDHFDADAAARLLAASPQTKLVASPEVVDRLLEVAPRLAGQTVSGGLTPGQSVVVNFEHAPVRQLGLRHNPTRRPAEGHMGFLIGRKFAVLHVGDAEPTFGNFGVLLDLPYIDPLVGLPIDVAFLPYWYLTDAASRKMVTTRIRPRRIVAMHVPPAEVAKVSAAIRATGLKAVVAGTPGTVVTLPD
jgi:L-ascorbate metabolism protein UlaG (beta-lactamase superfamily)